MPHSYGRVRFRWLTSLVFSVLLTNRRAGALGATQPYIAIHLLTHSIPMPAKKRSSATDPVITSASPDAASGSLGSVPTPTKSVRKRTTTTEAAAVDKMPAVKKASTRTVKSALESDAVAPKGASTRRAKSVKGAKASAAEVVEETVVVSESILVIEDLAIAAAKPVTEARETVATARVVTDDMIRQRAFYLSLERGRPGDPVADWLEAERSLRLRFA